jgi:hypothetical protein
MRNGSYLIFTLIGVEALALVIMPPYLSLNVSFSCRFIVLVMMAVGLVMAGKDATESQNIISEVTSELQIPATFIEQVAEVSLEKYGLYFLSCSCLNLRVGGHCI